MNDAAPAYNPGPVITSQPNSIGDQLLIDKLTNVKRFQLKQKNFGLEVLTGGACPNRYVISDLDRLIEVRWWR